jgi:hypothetical protein
MANDGISYPPKLPINAPLYTMASRSGQCRSNLGKHNRIPVDSRIIKW